MAAPGRHVGHCLQRNGRFLTNNLEKLWSHSFCRSFAQTPALQQQAAEANREESTETIVIPRKKTWSKEAVLEAMAATVGRDPTAYNYQFQDDAFLSPRTSTEFKLYLLAQESGRSSAKYFVNSNPKFFTKDFAEPHIPCLMPETVTLRLEERSEDALKERISLRKVTAAVDMYDQLLQAGTAVSMETTHDLLDLICIYCDKDPVQEGDTQTKDTEAGEDINRKKVRSLYEPFQSTWKENNNAERIFNLLPEKDTRCYSALIRGLVMHRAHDKAFSMHTDMLNNRVSGDVHIFNALITAAPFVKEKYNEKWELIEELLTQMKHQKVKPNLLTFNSVLKSLRRCGSLGKTKALQTLNEMIAIGITPSLASFNHILSVYFKSGSSAFTDIDMLEKIMLLMSGQRFTCQDPEDGLFFISAMRICLEFKDLDMGYKLHRLVEVGDNWRLLGEPYQQSIYYGRFFNLVCMMEQIDVVLKWYKKLIPSVYYPNSQGLKVLLQALDTDSRLDMLPQIWQDIRTLGHDNKVELVGEVLTLMAREQHSAEVQESFAACALEIKSLFDGDRGRTKLEWSKFSLTHITSLLLRANKTQQAWDMLQLFKSNNIVPSGELLNDFLSVCQSNGSPQKAVDLVQLSAAFCLPATAELAKRAMAEFNLTETQRVVLSELESAGESSD